MKKLSLILFFLISVLSTSIFPQGKGSLRGFVTDSTNGEAIAYANIHIKSSTFGSPTNNRGYYFIPSIPAGKHIAIVSYLGYVTREIPITIVNDEILQLNVKLIPSGIEMGGVSILGQRSARDNEIDLGMETITPKDIEMQPAGVEADIFRVIQSSPGVSSTGDVTSRYYVRGGGSDQNLLLLNGVPIYNPYHALGIFSVVDPEMISVMDFYKGGFTPEFGGRISSILNIITKDGNKNEFHGSANASFISGKASIEGPIPHGSFIVTARKSYFTEVLKNYLNDKEAPFNFYDLSFKANYSNPSLQNGMFLVHGFISRDELNNNDPRKEDYYVANKIFGFNWYQIWSSPLYSNFTLATSLYDAEVMPNNSDAKPRKNKVVDVTANLDFTYIYPSKDEFRFGLQNTTLKTTFSVENLYGEKTSLDMNGTELRGYANYKFYRFDNVAFDIGVRVNFANISDKGPFMIEPRGSIVWRPSNLISFKAAFGRYSQEVVTLTNENELISIFEPWTIVPKYLNPPEATHYIIGVETFLTENLSFNVEGYYKLMSSLFDINSAKYSQADNDYINVRGESYGLEFQTKYQYDGLFFQGSYSLSWAYKYKEEVKIIPRYDTRHSVNLLLGWDFGWGLNANASWSFSTGMPFTPIAGYYDRLQIDPWKYSYLFGGYNPVTFWAERNIGRLPFYHRLDLSINKQFKTGIADFTIGASVINVYDRKNIFYFDKETGEKVYMLPFLPSVTLKVEL